MKDELRLIERLVLVPTTEFSDRIPLSTPEPPCREPADRGDRGADNCVGLDPIERAAEAAAMLEDMDVAPTLYVMVGLPGAGKTTRARQLEVSNRALRLTPDEWMLPLFGAADVDGKRDILEGRLISLAIRGLRLGVSVILDFGVWSREERSALRWLAEQAGARCELVYLEVTGLQQRHRTETRFAAEGGFELADEELDEFRDLFEPPGQDELSNGSIDPAPVDYETWAAWAMERWPSFVP